MDFLLEENNVFTREEGVILGRRLLENDTIRHGKAKTVTSGNFICIRLLNVPYNKKLNILNVPYDKKLTILIWY